jgi:phospholipid-binding lipoprotein MlaA
MIPKAKLPFDPHIAAISCVGCKGSLFGAALLVVILAGWGCATVPATQPHELPATAPQTTTIVPAAQPLVVLLIEPQTATTVPAAQPPVVLVIEPQTAMLVPVSQPPVVLVIEPKATTIEAIIPEVYDPWKPFNGVIHAFNTDFFDTYLLKPIAGGYSKIMGEGERRLIRNVLDNLTMPKRFVNSLLVGKFRGAGRELSRFLINSTLGGLGMTDVAKYQFGIEKSDTDFGQTLEILGWTDSRYLVVPFVPSLTLRDGVGTVVDIALSPFTVLVPIPFAGGLAKDTVAYVNNRGLRLEIDQDMEEPLYRDLRSAYFIQRENLIQAR